MPKAIIVIGTDVKVGKTVVAAGIAAALGSRGIDVGVMKPVSIDETEINGEMISRDAWFLRQSVGVQDDISLINPYSYATQIAPPVAARVERREPVDLQRVEERFFQLSLMHEVIVIDTVGGLLSPVNEEETNLDLALRLGADAIVVGHGKIGTINHSLLTVFHAHNTGLHVSGVLINAHTTTKVGLIERTNPQEIRRLCPAPFLGILPWVDGVDMETGKIVGLADEVNRRVDLDSLMADDGADWDPGL